MWVHWVPIHNRKWALVCLTNSWLSFTPVLIELDVALYSPLNTHRRSGSVCRILDMYELRTWLRPLTSFIQLSGKASDYITYTHIFCRDISSSYRWKFFITTQEQDWAAVIMMAYKFHLEHHFVLKGSCCPWVCRFNVEKFSDSKSSRRLDYQDNGPAPAGFMTSTPHQKLEPVFSSPKAFQVG